MGYLIPFGSSNSSSLSHKIDNLKISNLSNIQFKDLITMTNPRTQTMVFVNDTDLPIRISSWRTEQEGIYAGSTSYKDVTILANTRETVYSDVGEWIIGSQFWNEEYNEQWEKEGLSQYSRIAKFRNEPCAWGDYTWNFIEESFILEHNDGVITWSRKPKSDS